MLKSRRERSPYLQVSGSPGRITALGRKTIHHIHFPNSWHSHQLKALDVCKLGSTEAASAPAGEVRKMRVP